MADHFYNEIAVSTHPDPIQLEPMSPGPTSFEPRDIEPISEPVRTPHVESRPIPDPATKIKKMKRCLIIMSVLLILLFCIAAAGMGLGLYSQLKPDDQITNGNTTTVATDTKSSTQMQPSTQSSSTESTQKTTLQSLPSTVTDTTVYVNPTSHQPNSATSQEPSSPSTATETITDEISSTSSSTTESTTYKDTTLKEPISTISTTEVNTTETTISQEPSPVTLTTEFTIDGILTSDHSSSLNATAEHSSSLNATAASAENTIHNIPTFLPPTASTTTSTTSTPTTPSVHLAGCEDVKNLTLGEGVYSIYPSTIPEGVEVYCDAEGWTVFQRRMDGSEDFNREWDDYVNGFGTKTCEFWLGLETIHQITKQDNYELRVELGDFQGNSSYAVYGSFILQSASHNYTLIVSLYSGTAGDSLSYHSGSQFSTKDVDNDEYPDSCAVVNQSGWWFKRCRRVNLNGIYHDFLGSGTYGVTWLAWKHVEYLKFSKIKFRKINL